MSSQEWHRDAWQKNESETLGYVVRRCQPGTCRKDVEKDANDRKNIFNDQSLIGINSKDRNPASVMYASQNQSTLIAK